MHTDNDNNETDLEKEYRQLGGASDIAMVTLMEINNKIEFLNEQMEKGKNYEKKNLNQRQ